VAASALDDLDEARKRRMQGFYVSQGGVGDWGTGLQAIKQKIKDGVPLTEAERAINEAAWNYTTQGLRDYRNIHREHGL